MTVAWSVVEPLSLLPSPQLMVHVQGESGMPGSLKVALTAWVWPENMAASAPATTVGATLFTVSPKVTDDDAPSLSVAVMVIVWLSAGPSTAPRLQVQAPLLPLPGLTLPTLAVMIALSGRPGSKKLPLLEAVSPSWTLVLPRLPVVRMAKVKPCQFSGVGTVQEKVLKADDRHDGIDDGLRERHPVKWANVLRDAKSVEATPGRPLARPGPPQPARPGPMLRMHKAMMSVSAQPVRSCSICCVRSGMGPPHPQSGWSGRTGSSGMPRSCRSISVSMGPGRGCMNTIAASTTRTGLVNVKAILCAPWSAGEPGDGPSL